jgi:hypothetical protein
MIPKPHFPQFLGVQCVTNTAKAGIPGTMEGELTEHPGFLTVCAYHIAVLVWVEGAKPSLKPGNARARQNRLKFKRGKLSLFD